MPDLPPALRACAVLLTAAFAAPTAVAQPPPEAGRSETVWHCWYNDDETYRCRLMNAPQATPKRPVDPRLHRSRPSLYPKRGPLPPIVKTIHDHPAELHGRTITIPVFTPPIDPHFSALLVQSVMCDIQPRCRAVILPSVQAVHEAYEEDPARDER